jgi:hypothetical protein
MNFKPPPSDMAKQVPKHDRGPQRPAKLLRERQLSTTMPGVRMADSDEVQGQELARPASGKQQIAEIAQIQAQFLIARNSRIGQEIGYSVKK